MRKKNEGKDNTGRQVNSGECSYQKGQAFNYIYKQLESNENLPLEDQLSLLINHYPQKLTWAQQNQALPLWGIQLYRNGQVLLNQLWKISFAIKETPTRKNLYKLSLIMDEMYQNLADFRKDVAEYQICLFSSSFDHKEGYIEVLSDLLEHLDLMEYRIMTNLDRKLSEIASGRMTKTAISISFTSLLLTVFWIYYYMLR